jgi:hypothetical protein
VRSENTVTRCSLVVTMVPLICGLFWGRHILKMNPALWLVGIAGVRTMIAGVAAVQIEIGQSRCHDRLLVRRGFRSQLSNDVGHRHRVPHDATVVGEPWTAVAQFAEDA